MKKFLLAAAVAETVLTGFRPPSLEVKEGAGTIVTLPERKAVKNLQELVLTAEREEAWLYATVPGRWHDIGSETVFLEGEVAGIILDETKIGSLAKRYHKLTLYHIHPQKAILNVMKSYYDSPEIDASEKEKIIKAILMDSVLPSPIDLAYAVRLSCQYDLRELYRYRVASVHGVTEYQPNRKNLKNYCSEKDRLALLLGALLLGEEITKKIDLFHLEKTVEAATARRKQVTIFSDEHFEIVFTPYDAL